MIDPEFAYCGPMAFDVGKILANLLLCFFALDGHASGKPGRNKVAGSRLAATRLQRSRCGSKVAGGRDARPHCAARVPGSALPA